MAAINFGFRVELISVLWRLAFLSTHGGYGNGNAPASADKVAGPVWKTLREKLLHPPENLSKEEQLQLPVFIPHRPLKDPRQIRMIDPACGPMHFGLYAFDLFEIIYQEATHFLGPLTPLPDSSSSTDHRSLTTDHLSPRDIPALILEHNIHGIDIDPRAAQIAGLALWLRAQRAWQEQGLRPADRPIAHADLGMGVLDAMVEVAAYVLRSLSESETRDLTHSIVPVLEKVALDKQDRFSLPKWQAARDGLKRHQAVAELEHLEAEGFVTRDSGEIVRYSPNWKSAKEVIAPQEPAFPLLMCIRALAESDKGIALVRAVTTPSDPIRFLSDPAQFSKMPSSPFAYWVPT